MVRRFLASSRWPLLVYLRAPMLDALAGTGLHCAGIGVDRHVDLEALRARPSKPVQGAIKKARKAGLELRALDLDALDPATRERLDAITSAYLAHAKVNTEMAFLNWPMGARADGLRRGCRRCGDCCCCRCRRDVDLHARAWRGSRRRRRGLRPQADLLDRHRCFGLAPAQHAFAHIVLE